MSPQRKALFVWLTLFAIAVTAGARQTSSSIHDHLFALVQGFVCVLLSVLAGLASVVLWLAKRRGGAKQALLVMVLAFMAGFLPWLIQGHRISLTEDHLASVYAKLAAKGPPFPLREESGIDPLPSGHISCGYWVSPDRARFEVFYHVSSNSYTMAYPEAGWVWRDFHYQGPDARRGIPPLSGR